MKFYYYGQNNSGGSFHDVLGLKGVQDLCIEAQSPRAADAIAEDLGVYFDGIADGIDCPCCGDRWDGAAGNWLIRPMTYPHRYGQELAHAADGDVLVVFANGTRHRMKEKD